MRIASTTTTTTLSVHHHHHHSCCYNITSLLLCAVVVVLLYMSPVVVVVAESSTSTSSSGNSATITSTRRPHQQQQPTQPRRRRRRRSTAKLRLYLVRHGESSANKWGILAGQEDVPLTDAGKEDAVSLGTKSEFFLRDNTNNFWWRVYSSDSQRAHDTALFALTSANENELINQIQLDRRLRERSYGARQGFPTKMSEQDALQVWHDYNLKPPPYETDDDIWERVKEWMEEEVLEQVRTVERLEQSVAVDDDDDDDPSTSNSNDDEEEDPSTTKTYNVLVTSHAGVVRTIILKLVSKETLQEKGAKYDPARNNRLIIPNTSVTILEIDPYLPLKMENVRVIELTNADHLENVKVVDD